MRRAVLALLLLACAVPLHAAELVVAKSTALVSDGLGALTPRFLPGGEIDVALTVTNPLDNIGRPVRVVVIEDVVAPAVALRVAGYASAAAGPVEFADGLPVSAVASNLGYRWGGLGDATDAVEFYDGTTWAYIPVPDAAGYDARVRRIRVTLTGTQATGSAFRLRYRTRIKP